MCCLDVTPSAVNPNLSTHLPFRMHAGVIALVALLWAATAAAGEVPDAYVQTCQPATFPERTCIQAPVPTASPLTIGQKATSRVDALCWWNRTGILLEQSAVYDVKVTATIESWRDAEMAEADLKTGWNGGIASFIGFFAKLLARDIHSPMYSLVGARGKSSEDFVLIGERTSVTGTHAEPVEMLVFANDWPSKYKNNHGCLELTITRTR
jgi:hypothetical protein